MMDWIRRVFGRPVLAMRLIWLEGTVFPCGRVAGSMVFHGCAPEWAKRMAVRMRGMRMRMEVHGRGFLATTPRESAGRYDAEVLLRVSSRPDSFMGAGGRLEFEGVEVWHGRSERSFGARVAPSVPGEMEPFPSEFTRYVAPAPVIRSEGPRCLECGRPMRRFPTAPDECHGAGRAPGMYCLRSWEAYERMQTARGVALERARIERRLKMVELKGNEPVQTDLQGGMWQSGRPIVADPTLPDGVWLMVDRSKLKNWGEDELEKETERLKGQDDFGKGWLDKDWWKG